MIVWVVLLLLVLVLFGVGFSIHLLWIVAIVLLIAWLLGFMRNGRSGSGRSGGGGSGWRRR